MGIALPVVDAASIVDTAVDFHREKRFRTVEVDNESGDDVLSAESKAKSPSTKLCPQPLLRRSEPLAEGSGQFDLVACCRPRRARQGLFHASASHALLSTRPRPELLPPLPPQRGKGSGEGGTRAPRPSKGDGSFSRIGIPFLPMKM